MKKALMKEGIPENVIFLDYAGFRTLDSVVRGKKVFGQSRYTIVSQPFHNKRAVFIARQYNIQAVAFNAQDVSAQIGFKTQFREIFARVNVFLDLYVFFTQPKFLGDEVKIF
jgi:SanA protein